MTIDAPRTVTWKERVRAYIPDLAILLIVSSLANEVKVDKDSLMPVVIGGVYILGRMVDLWSTKLSLDAGNREASILSDPAGKELWTYRRAILEGVLLIGALDYHPFALGMAMASARVAALNVKNAWMASHDNRKG